MRSFWLVILLLACSQLRAAMCGISWPGWDIGTDEFLPSPRYPLSRLFDGDPKTAWVYYKPWKDNIDQWEDPEKAFNHGVGVNLYCAADASLVLDGISIINGYAKDRATYLRNNRVTAIRVMCDGGGKDWSQTFTLKETTAPQFLKVPHLRVSHVTLQVKAVAPGNDNDLCLSELAFMHGTQRIAWGMTPYVLSTPQMECDGAPAYTILNGTRKIILPGAREGSFDGFRQPHTTRVLLRNGRALYLYDLQRGVIVWRYTLPQDPKAIGWQDATHALVRTLDARGRERWYCLDTGRMTLRHCAKPDETARQRLRELDVSC